MSRRKRERAYGERSDLLGALYPTLDLHGLTASEAVARTRAWLVARHDDSDLTVRVITGRGLHSVGPAVLPGEIEELLRSLGGTLVASFEAEPGGGVFRVRLAPAKRRPRRADPPPLRDATLVREAEEALSELGIQPTPALVDAEIRRILEERAKGAG